MGWLKERRRARIRRSGLPEAWRRLVKRSVPYVRLLPPADRAELEGKILVFLAEKRFEGTAGLAISDQIRLTIAAQACILLLHRRTDYYPGLYSIVVYPRSYVAHQVERDESGIVTEGPQPRLGESWKEGAVVLSWADVKRDAAEPGTGHNVVFHEFAHQLDAEAGRPDGAPLLPDPTMYRTWSKTFEEGYAQLQRELASGREPPLDPYAALNPAEFFAVATETFFEKPRELRRRMPGLHEQLRAYYNQDPAAFVPESSEPTNR